MNEQTLIWFDSCIFSEIRREKKVFARRTLVVKDHMFQNNMKIYNSAILLIRNPYKAHIAEFNRQKSSNKTGYATDADFLSEGMYALASEW